MLVALMRAEQQYEHDVRTDIICEQHTLATRMQVSEFAEVVHLGVDDNPEVTLPTMLWQA